MIYILEAVLLTLLLLAVGFLILLRAKKIIPVRSYLHEFAHDIEKARHRPTPRSWDDSRLTVAWLGHATILVNFRGTVILIDPVLSERIMGPVIGGKTRLGPRRVVEAPLAVDELPPVDLVLITHAHYDHLDRETLGKLPKDSDVVVPDRVREMVDRYGFRSVTELSWGQSCQYGGVTVSAHRGKHWGRRAIWAGKDRGYNSYVISRGDENILLVGDTAYCETFKQLGRDSRFDLAFVPIGAYRPRSFEAFHITPEQAWRIFLESNAKYMIPIHWGTFILSLETLGEPLYRLRKAAGNDEHGRIVLTEIGASWTKPD